MNDLKAREALRKWVKDLWLALPKVSYYQLLGVPSDTLEPQVRDAYYKLATLLHPDRYRNAMDDETARHLVSVYSHVVEAYRVLIDGRKREQYDQGLEQGKLRWSPEDGRALKNKEEAKTANGRRFFRLGRAALLAGDAKAAVMNFRLALSVEPENLALKSELDKAEAALRSQGS